MKLHGFFITSFVLLVLSSVLAGSEDSVNEFLRLGVHRGGKGLFPENTIYAYTESIKRWRGCLLEGDIRLTKDGVPVLIHDATVDRTTNSSGSVAEKTLQELKTLDAGYKFTSDGGNTYPFRGKGITIPTLEEVLDTFPTETFLFEIKVPLEDVSVIAEPILKRKMEEMVYLASVHTATIQKIRASYPQLKTCYTIADAGPLIDALRNGGWERYSPPAQMLAMSPNLVNNFKFTSEEIDAIRGKGVKVLVFTINSSEYMKKYLMEYKVDWILTDYPDRYELIVNSLRE